MSTTIEITGTPEEIARLKMLVETGRLTELAGHKILGQDPNGKPDVTLDIGSGEYAFLTGLLAQPIARKEK